MKRKLTTKQWFRRERVLDRRAAGRHSKWWDIGWLWLIVEQAGKPLGGGE
jgi:hypothetical protein